MSCFPRLAALSLIVAVSGPMGNAAQVGLAADWFAKGVAATKRGDRTLAERCYREAVRLEPRNAGAWANLGLVLGASGRHTEAVGCFERAARHAPTEPDFAAQSALSSLRSGDLRGAEAKARRVLGTHPANALALSALSGSLAAQRRYGEAVASLRLLDSVRKGNDPEVIRSIAFCQSASGAPDLALALLRNRIVRFPRVASLARLHGDIAGQLGFERKDKSLLLEAKGAYVRAFTANPKDSRAGVNAALAAEMAGLPLEAKALYGQVLRRNPGDGAAHYGLGRVLLSDPTLSEVARVSSARPHFEAAVSAAPRNVDYLVALGFALGMVGPGETENAANILRAAIRIAPRDGRARRGLVEVLVKGNRPAEAISAQRTLVESEPDDKEARRRLAGLLRATGADSAAWEQLREIARRDPKEVDALKELGILLEQAGKLDEAVAALKSATERAPKDADAATSLGLVLEKQGKRSEAIGRYRSAIGIDATHAAANIALASALETAGDSAGAMAARSAWLQADPTSNAARWEVAQGHVRAGRDDEAIQLLQGLVLRRGDPQRNQYLTAVAALHMERKRWPEAATELRRLLMLEPTEDLRFRLLDVLGRAGRFDEAAREAEVLVASAKDKVRARIAVAELHETSGRLDDAARGFEDLLGRHGHLAGVAEGVLRVRTAQGRRDEALKLLEATAMAGPGAPPVPVVRLLDRSATDDRVPTRFGAFTERLAIAFPNERSVLAVRAEVLLRGRPSDADRREAARLYGRMGALDPRDADSPFQQGRQLQAVGDRDAAVGAYRESARRKPGGPAEAVLKSMGLLPPSKAGTKP